MEGFTGGRARGALFVLGLLVAGGCGNGGGGASGTGGAAGNDAGSSGAGGAIDAGSSGGTAGIGDAGDAGQQTFTVSGTVSGLDGTGLVLDDGLGDQISIDADGPFAFAAKVADGSNVSVQVATQPTAPGQTCTVAGGTAKAIASDLTTVAVTCTTDTFEVGGTVTGLSGTGLVLQNNASDDLPIAADGAFTFATPLPSGQSFVVTVKSQPTAPDQTCAVSNGTGMVTDSDISTVTIDCVLLDTDGDGVLDSVDACPSGDTGWTSSPATDHDGDGCRDATEDADDDNDGIADTADACPLGETGWASDSTTDHDSDGCRDTTEDSDDDNDGVPDTFDLCPSGNLGWVSTPSTDAQGDGCQDGTPEQP